MIFDDLIKILLGGICRLSRVSLEWSSSELPPLPLHPSRWAKSSPPPSPPSSTSEQGYLVMLLNQMKCLDYKIYWKVFVNIEPFKCNEHHFMFMCEVFIHFRVTYVLPECWFISVPANFRHSICPILAKVMPDFSVNLSMTCARICRKYRVPRIC